VYLPPLMFAQVRPPPITTAHAPCSAGVLKRRADVNPTRRAAVRPMTANAPSAAENVSRQQQDGSRERRERQRCRPLSFYDQRAQRV